MHLSTAMNVQNRGAFHIEAKAFKSGGTSSDRQFSGNAYMFDDTMQFRRYDQESEAASQRGLGLWIDHLMNMDNRVFTSLAATVLFGGLAQATFDFHALVTVALSTVFFVVWYVMSFFDFQRVLNVVVAGPQARNQETFAEPYYMQASTPVYPEELYTTYQPAMPSATYSPEYAQAFYPEYASQERYPEYAAQEYYPEYAQNAPAYYPQATAVVDDNYYYQNDTGYYQDDNVYYQAQPQAQTRKSSNVVGPAFVGYFPAATPAVAY